MKASKTAGLVIDGAEFFEDEDFQQWLNLSPSTPRATWHEGGPVTPGSDLFVLVDPSLSGEGSDSDMPEHIWDQIVATCREHFAPASTDGHHILVWIRND